MVAADRSVTLWEPGHGVVVATPRDPARTYLPGSQAWLSSGLAGADRWVCSPAGGPATEAEVDLDEVAAFLAGHGLLPGTG